MGQTLLPVRHADLCFSFGVLCYHMSDMCAFCLRAPSLRCLSMLLYVYSSAPVCAYSFGATPQSVFSSLIYLIVERRLCSSLRLFAALEDSSKASVFSVLTRVNECSKRSPGHFDKYKAFCLVSRDSPVHGQIYKPREG